jgi:hypothetical protein
MKVVIGIPESLESRSPLSNQLIIERVLNGKKRYDIIFHKLVRLILDTI